MTEIIKKIPWVKVAAEAITIVVGILLALSIDAWYERRTERVLEVQYLQRIHDELEAATGVLDAIFREAEGNLMYADDLTAFFDARVAKPDAQRVIVAINRFGLDPLLGFDTSTYDDLVSTGRLNLISDHEVRQAIQRAYTQLERVEPIRDPYRDEYKFALSGLIPTSIRQQIANACPVYQPYSACSGLYLDEAMASRIVEQANTREGLMAFNIRETGLKVINGLGHEVLKTVEETLALLEAKSVNL